eukprot:43564-Chlamydomonas_euryale.AAC.1
MSDLVGKEPATQDHGKTSRLSSFSGSHSSPQDSASFRSDIHGESYGYDSVEGMGEDRSASSGGASTKRGRGHPKNPLPSLSMARLWCKRPKQRPRPRSRPRPRPVLEIVV